MSPTNKAVFESLLLSKKMIVCVGAGGVGKTTVAASTALWAARQGKRVACLTIDPARRLADSLGLSDEKRLGEISDISHVLGNGNPNNGRIGFGMLDAKATFDEMVRQKTSSSENAKKILKNRLYQYVSSSLSGMQEYMALERLCQLNEEPAYDLVILDTPPTSNVMDFFTAPKRMKNALDGQLVRMMSRIYRSSGRPHFDLLGRWAASVLRVLSRVTGTQLLNEIMDFVDALSDLFGNFFERASNMERVLLGNDVAVLLISTPVKASVDETRELKNALERIGFHVSGVLFNQAHWPSIHQAIPQTVPHLERVAIEQLNTQWNDAHEQEAALAKGVQAIWSELHSVGVIPLLPLYDDKIQRLDNIWRSMIVL